METQAVVHPSKQEVWQAVKHFGMLLLPIGIAVAGNIGIHIAFGGDPEATTAVSMADLLLSLMIITVLIRWFMMVATWEDVKVLFAAAAGIGAGLFITHLLFRK